MSKAGEGDLGRIAAWARQGHVEAQILHAQALLDAGDAAGAFAWWGIAASTGDAKALNMLGRCHECGWGTPRDDAMAEPLYRRAAEAGLDWAQYNLGGVLARRGAVAEALRWYRAAAAQGLAKAINLVARFTEEGWATPRDPPLARELYRRAAEGGDFRAQCNHAQALREASRRAEAAQWFARAAAGGTPGFLRSLATGLAEAPEPELRAIARSITRHIANDSQNHYQQPIHSVSEA